MVRALAVLAVSITLLAGLSASSVYAYYDIWNRSESDPDAAFLTQLLKKRETECLESWTVPIDEEIRGWCAVDLYIDREDLNKDGVYELIVYFEQGTYMCGTAGCALFIYQKRDDEWAVLSHGQGGVEVFDDPRGEWPVLIYYGYSGRIWTGTDDGGAYQWFCVSDRCRREGG